ncbi:MAG: PKD domain-containing protein [Ardenticatenaceae bacterium]|nr:PKD domain-containing protein [Ardenticatenaceae bacterium]
MPISDELTPEQILAQDLALANAEVQRYTFGRRSEVFGVHQILADEYTKKSSACATADCRQVEIYNFDDNAAITAIVNVDTSEVLDVLYLPHMHPGINKRLNDLALEIALNAPEVIEILGYQPEAADMAPVEANSLGTSCDLGHLCAAPTFELGDRVLWAIVDLTDEKLAGIDWTNIDPTGSSTYFAPDGCPISGNVNRDGWTLDYAVTGNDGLRVYNIAYNGTDVATSIKTVEWHADYGSSGYVDATGCSPSGGFPIYPYGDAQVLDLLDDQNNVIGFEVVQDFRMGNWGNSCNYRYEQRMRFYNDGRFRPVSGAYGKGCGTNALYRPVTRIDIAVSGDANDSFARWDGAQWADVTTENYFVPYTETGHGPHEIDANGYSWRVSDSVAGVGYYMVQDVGQYDGDNGHGDDPFVYAVLHHTNEGDTDLGAIGSCCNDNHQQGPHTFINGENIQDVNLVLWYVPQSLTDASSPDYYCWTLQGEPNPVTYPCFSGPMFVPFSQAPTAAFTHSTPNVTTLPTTFQNASSGTGNLSYLWEFGDGATSTLESPTHQYTISNTYTITLTVTNAQGSDSFVDTISVYEPLLNPPGGGNSVPNAETVPVPSDD